MVCANWASRVSCFLKLEYGIRQGGVLSPYFFIINVVNVKSGCSVNRACLSVILYADDILLLAPSVESLQKLVTVPLNLLHLTCLLRSVCMSICHNSINTVLIYQLIHDGQELNWVQSCRYLGITDESASRFKCNIGEAKNRFTDPLMQSLVGLVELQRKMSQWNY